MALASNLPPAARHLPTWIFTFLLALLAWIPTLQQSLTMPPMPGTMGMSLAAFLLFWAVMMIAMMLPALAPMLSLHLVIYQKACGWHPLIRLSAFVCGYLLLWTLVGLPAFLLALWGQTLVFHTPALAIDVGAAILIVAGLYYLLPIQRRCLVHCNPMLESRSHLTYPNANSPLREIEAGLQHGFICLGACGGLMLALIATSVMNIPAMLIVTLLVFVTKLWRYGRQLSILIGLGLILIGILALRYPVVLIPGFALPK